MTVPSHIAVCGHCPRRIASYSETETRPTDPHRVLDVVLESKTLGTNILVHCPSWRRGYVVLHITIQHWLKTEKEIPNQSAARIFAAATSILKVGTPAAGSH